MIQPIIMCKAPVAGRVKTRLIPAYTPVQAAEIHATMAVTVIERLGKLFPHTWIAVDELNHPFFHRFEFRQVQQGGGDLGRRMSRLLQQACAAGATGALFLGVDSPHMGEARIQQAVQGLGQANVVIGPVEDGGYELIALDGCYKSIFENIEWGGSQVCAQTIAAAHAAGLRVNQLLMGFDVDLPDDVARAVQSGWGKGARFVIGN